MKSVAKASFLNIGFADPKGDAFLQNGRIVNISDRDYFKKAMSGKRGASVVASSKLGKEPRLILSVPIIKGTEAIGVMYGSYSEEIFKKYLLNSHLKGGHIIYMRP